jgi:hypothetical protein
MTGLALDLPCAPPALGSGEDVGAVAAQHSNATAPSLATGLVQRREVAETHSQQWLGSSSCLSTWAAAGELALRVLRGTRATQGTGLDWIRQVGHPKIRQIGKWNYRLAALGPAPRVRCRWQHGQINSRGANAWFPEGSGWSRLGLPHCLLPRLGLGDMGHGMVPWEHSGGRCCGGRPKASPASALFDALDACRGFAPLNTSRTALP